MTYSELTRRYFESPPAVGELAVGSVAAALEFFRGRAGRRDRGTWVQFDIQAKSGRLLDARFLAFGCPHTIAVASWVAEQAPRSTLCVALPEPVQALRARFDVPQEKMGRLLIIEDAWLAVIKAALTTKPYAPISPDRMTFQS